MATRKAPSKGPARKKADPKDFKLEEQEPGKIPQRVIDELVVCRGEAKNYVGAFSDAIKAQAEKHKVDAGALRRYVCAIEADKTEGLKSEMDDLERLLA